MANRKDNKNNPDSCHTNYVAACFHVTPQTIYLWTKDGCPRNPDGCYSIHEIHNWILDKMLAKSDKGSLSQQKLEKDIEFRDAQIQKIRGTLIDRSLMETILASRASNLRRHLTKTFIGTSIYLVGKTIDEIRTILLEMATKAMDAYIGGSNEPK